MNEDQEWSMVCFDGLSSHIANNGTCELNSDFDTVICQSISSQHLQGLSLTLSDMESEHQSKWSNIHTIKTIAWANVTYISVMQKICQGVRKIC